MTSNDMEKTPENACENDPREFDFRDLAGEEREILIVFEGKKYRLLATKNGKLLLNR